MSRSNVEPIPKGFVIGGLLAVVGFVFVMWFLFASTWASTPPDKYMLHYSGGPLDGTHFQELIQPGSGTRFLGLMENTYYLPSTQRNYIVSRGADEGDKAGVDFMTGVSSDNVQFTIEAAVYFKLNPDPQTLRLFLEQICLHDDCTNLSPGKGWDHMLDQYFRPQLENAIRLEMGKYNREQLYRDPDSLVSMQNDISGVLKDRITSVIGGEFFCGPDAAPTNCTNLQVVLKNPTPPDNVATSYANTAAATQDVITAQQQAAAKRESANGDRDAQNARAEAKPLTQDQLDYIRAQAMATCAANANCTLVITPDSGTGVNVNVGTG